MWQTLEIPNGESNRGSLEALAIGNVPAIVFRQAMNPSACQQLVWQLLDEQLLFDPHQPMPESFRDKVIPEGFYREGAAGNEAYAWSSDSRGQSVRIDIGTSLGYRGSDPEAFFDHAAATHELFGHLFRDINPVETIYTKLQELAGEKNVMTACEPDGRPYGPAIVRAHYGAYTYKPHFDSVRDREKRTEYAVHDFETQLAGVLVLQNASDGSRTAQCKIHNTFWSPEIEPHLSAGTFHDYATEKRIDNVEVCLESGDLYFFNTGAIHEVPGVSGDLPRVVVATFIGYSRDRDDVFVWS